METYDIMEGQVDEGAVTLAVNLVVAFGYSFDFASEVVPCRLWRECVC